MTKRNNLDDADTSAPSYKDIVQARVDTDHMEGGEEEKDTQPEKNEPESAQLNEGQPRSEAT